MCFFFLVAQHNAKLQEFLPKLLDTTVDSTPDIKAPPVMRPPSSRDLCDRYVRTMELVGLEATVFTT